MKTSKKIGGLLLLLVAVAVCFFSIPAAAGVAFATTALVTDTVTPDAVRDDGQGLDMYDISTKVTEILPARVPLNKIMRDIRSATKAESEELKYYSVSSKALYDIPDDAASGAGTSSSVPCEAYTYSSGDGLTSIWVQVTNPDLWQKDKTVMLFDLLCNSTVAASPTSYADVVFWVRVKTGAVVELVPLNGCKGAGSNATKYVVPNFAKTAKFFQAGIAKESTAIQTIPFAMLPQADYQYCQNFLAQVEEARFQKMTKKEVNFGFKDYEKQNIWQMAVEQELDFLFGIKDHLYDSTESNYRYTTEGITRRIDTVLNYGTGSGNTTVSQDDYLTWLETVFTGNNGSEERVLFAGSGLMKSLHSIDEYTKQLNGTNTVIQWGVTFNKIVSDFGTLLVMQHPLFSQIYKKDYGIILDMAHVQKHDFVPMQVTTLDLVKPGTRNADAKVIQECSAMTLTNPDCHAIIKPKA